MNQRYSFFGFPERLASWQKLLPYALLLIVTLALYGPALYFDFVWDDFYYLAKNYQIQGFSPQHLRMIWTTSYLGHFAPIHHLFLSLLYFFSGTDHFGYHLGQLLVHAACVCLLYFLLQKLESPRIALLASLLFAAYPANIETVAWISETKSTVAFFFFLLSFWTFVLLRERGKWWLGVLCAIFFILSMLAKINTIVAPAIFLLWDYKQGDLLKKGRIWSLAAFFLLSAMFVVIHLASFYRTGQVLEGSAYYGGLLVHLMNVPLFVLFYIQMVVFPHPLSAWQMFPVFQGLHWAVGVSWFSLLGLLGILSRTNRAVQFWGLWFLVFLAPVLQLFPFGIWVADRYLYIPAVGGFVLASKGFFWVADRWTKLGQRVAWEAAMGAILLAFAWHTHHHLPVWHNDLTLWGATVQRCTTSAYCHGNLGSALLRYGQTEWGVKELIRGIELRSAPRYLIRLGDAYTTFLRDYRQALIAYTMAREQGGSEINADFYASLARLHILMGNMEEARRALQSGQEKQADNPNLLVVTAFFHWKQGELENARQALRRALRITGTHSNIAVFIHLYWADAADVRRLLADLGSSPLGDP